MTERDADVIHDLVLDLADIRAQLDVNSALLKGIQEKLAQLITQRHALPKVVQALDGNHVKQD